MKTATGQCDCSLSLLTVSEVTARLRLSRSTFYNLVKDGRLRTCKVRNATRIRSDVLEEFIASLPTENAPAEKLQP